MSDPINLETLLQELGPRFAEKAAAQEDADAFVAEN
jgi:hypothetical protein